MRKLIFLSVFLMSASVSWAQCVTPCVQTNIAASGSNAGVFSVTLPSNVTSGHAIVVSLGFCANGACSVSVTTNFNPSLTDNGGVNGLYPKIADTQVTNQWRVITWLLCNANTSVAVNMFTVNSNFQSMFYPTLSATEFSGTPTSCMDQNGISSTTTLSTTHSTSTSMNAASNKVIVYSAALQSFVPVPGAGFNLLNFSSFIAFSDQYRENPSAGCAPETASWTSSMPSTWSQTVITILETGGSLPNCGGVTAKNLTLLGVGH